MCFYLVIHLTDNSNEYAFQMLYESRVLYRIRLVESEKKNETNYTAALDDARPFDTNSNARMRAA